MRYFLGCDVCKSKIDVALVSEQGAVLWTDKVPNQTVDIAEYLLTLSSHHIDDEIICIAEDTSIYHHPLLEACHTVAVPCRTYNPILTRQGIKGSIRGKKTDKSDAILIARMGIRGEGRINTPEPYKTTRYAARAQQRLGNLSGSVKLYQRHVEEVLEGDLSNEAKELLEAIQTQFALARKQFVIDTAKSAPPDLMRKLQTIPGVGPYIAASIIGEIQDMERFHTSKQLIAYAGLDPKIKQSGHSLNKTGRLTKRCSDYLRRSLFIAASIARRYDPNFKALYDKKRDEGKTYKVAVCVVARKLLTVVRAVWLTNKDYDIGAWSATDVLKS
jgi:transposase